MNKLSLDSTITLNNGVKIPRIGLGVWKTSNKIAAESVQDAIKNGYRLIDTAKQYGNEAGVGAGITQALKDNHLTRKDIFLTTKVFNGDQGYQSTLDNFSGQLERLQTDYIDLLLIHWPVTDKYLDTYKALVELYKAGKIRAIGVSNFDAAHLQEIIDNFDVVPAVNQMEYHPLCQEKEIKDFCDMHNIRLEAWSPLGGGDVLANPTLVEIANKYGKTPAQVILRWDLQNEVITIPKSVHVERIQQNVNIFDFALSAEDMEKIANLDQNKHSLWYEDFAWSGNPDGFKDSISNLD